MVRQGTMFSAKRAWNLLQQVTSFCSGHSSSGAQVLEAIDAPRRGYTVDFLREWLNQGGGGGGQRGHLSPPFS